MKGIAIGTLHKIHRYQEGTLSVKKHQGPSHAFIHQSVHTNPTRLGGVQGRHKTLWAVFLATLNTKAQQKNSEGTQIHKHTLCNLFCLLSARTSNDTSAWNRSYRAGTQDWCNANIVCLQPNHSLQLYPFISGGYTAQSMDSSCTGG